MNNDFQSVQPGSYFNTTDTSDSVKSQSYETLKNTIEYNVSLSEEAGLKLKKILAKASNYAYPVYDNTSLTSDILHQIFNENNTSTVLGFLTHLNERMNALSKFEGKLSEKFGKQNILNELVNKIIGLIKNYRTENKGITDHNDIFRMAPQKYHRYILEILLSEAMEQNILDSLEKTVDPYKTVGRSVYGRQETSTNFIDFIKVNKNSTHFSWQTSFENLLELLKKWNTEGAHDTSILIEIIDRNTTQPKKPTILPSISIPENKVRETPEFTNLKNRLTRILDLDENKFLLLSISNILLSDIRVIKSANDLFNQLDSRFSSNCVSEFMKAVEFISSIVTELENKNKLNSILKFFNKFKNDQPNFFLDNKKLGEKLDFTYLKLAIQLSEMMSNQVFAALKQKICWDECKNSTVLLNKLHEKSDKDNLGFVNTLLTYLKEIAQLNQRQCFYDYSAQDNSLLQKKITTDIKPLIEILENYKNNGQNILGVTNQAQKMPALTTATDPMDVVVTNAYDFDSDDEPMSDYEFSFSDDEMEDKPSFDVAFSNLMNEVYDHLKKVNFFNKLKKMVRIDGKVTKDILFKFFESKSGVKKEQVDRYTEYLIKCFEKWAGHNKNKIIFSDLVTKIKDFRNQYDDTIKALPINSPEKSLHSGTEINDKFVDLILRIGKELSKEKIKYLRMLYNVPIGEKIKSGFDLLTFLKANDQFTPEEKSINILIQNLNRISLRSLSKFCVEFIKYLNGETIKKIDSDRQNEQEQKLNSLIQTLGNHLIRDDIHKLQTFFSLSKQEKEKTKDFQQLAQLLIDKDIISPFNVDLLIHNLEQIEHFQCCKIIEKYKKNIPTDNMRQESIEQMEDINEKRQLIDPRKLYIKLALDLDGMIAGHDLQSLCVLFQLTSVERERVKTFLHLKNYLEQRNTMSCYNLNPLIENLQQIQLISAANKVRECKRKIDSNGQNTVQTKKNIDYKKILNKHFIKFKFNLYNEIISQELKTLMDAYKIPPASQERFKSNLDFIDYLIKTGKITHHNVDSLIHFAEIHNIEGCLRVAKNYKDVIQNVLKGITQPK